MIGTSESSGTTKMARSDGGRVENGACVGPSGGGSVNGGTERIDNGDASSGRTRRPTVVR